MSKLMPRQPVPELAVPLVAGGAWRLADQAPENFTLICFYRGLHCPICKTYVKELDRLVDDFAQRGVKVIAISSDSQERAQQTAAARPRSASSNRTCSASPGCSPCVPTARSTWAR